MLLVRARGAFTPGGHFGAANCVTALRLLLVGVLSVLPRATSGTWLGSLVLLILLLDGVDGWLARRHRTSSAFGAHFDMEVDAFLVLTTSSMLWLSQRCGAWVLTAGILRYAYVLCCAVWPPRGGVMPRTLLGRSAFVLVVIGHALGFALAGALGTGCAALGTAAVTWSFVRSFLFGYGPRTRPLVDS